MLAPSFLHKLKLLTALILVGLFWTSCQQRSGQSPLPQSERNMISTVLHIGDDEDYDRSYRNLDSEGKVSIRITNDKSQLMLRYNVACAQDVLLRLYDGEGNLRHMERSPEIKVGAEQSLDLTRLPGGPYNLQVNLEDGVELSQQITLHTRKNL